MSYLSVYLIATHTMMSTSCILHAFLMIGSVVMFAPHRVAALSDPACSVCADYCCCCCFLAVRPPRRHPRPLKICRLFFVVDEK
jgi:hypothetical protein